MPKEERGLGSRSAYEVARAWRLALSLQTPNRVQKLQGALHAKAKESRNPRFNSPYGLRRWFGERTESISVPNVVARKAQSTGKGLTRCSFETLYEELGRVRISGRARNFPWANA